MAKILHIHNPLVIDHIFQNIHHLNKNYPNILMKAGQKGCTLSIQQNSGRYLRFSEIQIFGDRIALA
jgi:hypothetical protein